MSAVPIGPRVSGWPELGDAQRRVLLELLLRGEQSRVRLAEAVGLSRASLTRIARDLLELGLVVEGAVEQKATRGRPGEMLRLRPEAGHFVGVKLTGEALYLVVTDLSARVVAATTRALPDRDVAGVVALIAEVARETAGAWSPVAIGVGLAGDVERNGEAVLRASHFLGWDAVPLERHVAEATGLPTTVSNDVHALAAAHHWFDGLEHYRSLVVYGLGAGIGSGVVIEGELMEGAHGRSGRVGHARVGGEGRVCDNGHGDCIHSFVTMPSIEANAGVPYAEALERARAGEPRASAALERAAYALGAAIADSVNAFDPEAVCLLGEGLDMADVAPEAVRRGLSEFLENVAPETVRIERPPFTFELYARGAAVAAMRDLLE